MSSPTRMAAELPDDAVPPRGWLFIALLALQFGLQPLFTKGCIERSADKVPLVLLCEVLKGVAALLIIVVGDGMACLRHWRAFDSLASGAVPAVLYAVQNVCIQVGYQNISGLHFNLLNQSKVIFTAIATYLLMGKRQSPLQCVSLTLVLAVGVLLSLPPRGAAASVASAEFDFFYGILPSLLASLLSGMAAAWSQRIMQGTGQRNAYLYSLELGVYSSVLLTAQMLFAEDGSFAAVAERVLPTSLPCSSLQPCCQHCRSPPQRIPLLAFSPWPPCRMLKSQLSHPGATADPGESELLDPPGVERSRWDLFWASDQVRGRGAPLFCSHWWDHHDGGCGIFDSPVPPRAHNPPLPTACCDCHVRVRREPARPRQDPNRLRLK